MFGSHPLRVVPLVILAATVGLSAFGWLAIRRAEDFRQAAPRFADQQLVWYAVAFGVMLVALRVPYRRLQRLSYAAFGLSLILLAAAFLFPPVNGAHRWIRLGPIGVQPSEFAKLAYVMALSRYLMYRQHYRSLGGLLLPLALTCLPVLLILKEPDLGTAMLFLPVMFAMLWAAGTRTADLAKLVLAGLLVLPLLWSQMSREQRSRVTALLNQTPPGAKPASDGYQLYQSKQMVALGGWLGSAVSGDAVDDPGAYHLPEAHTDFIFSVLLERYGVWGAGLVLGLYTILVCGGLHTAAVTQDPFGRLLCVGCASLLGVQALVNASVAVGLLPVTGLSLPLVSYGGSSLCASGLILALMVNIGLRPGYEVSPEPFRWNPDAAA